MSKNSSHPAWVCVPCHDYSGEDGEAVDGFNSALPESEIRKVLEKHIKLPEEDPYEKAHRIWGEGDIDGALGILTEMNQKDPENLKVLIDLAQLKAETGDLETAEQILESLPPEEKLQHQAKQLAARIKFLKQSAELPPVKDLEMALEQDRKILTLCTFWHFTMC